MDGIAASVDGTKEALQEVASKIESSGAENKISLDLVAGNLQASLKALQEELKAVGVDLGSSLDTGNTKMATSIDNAKGSLDTLASNVLSSVTALEAQLMGTGKLLEASIDRGTADTKAGLDLLATNTATAGDENKVSLDQLTTQLK